MLQDDFPDIFGDAHALPFCDDSFDFIICQGVLEHLSNPFNAADEMYRVLKRSGKIYLDTAFIQPYHGVPWHYFNFTLSGLREVMKSFTEISSSAYGGLCDIMRWHFEDIGLKVKLGEQKYNKIIQNLQEVDLNTNEQERAGFSCVVQFWGCK
jgi:ubiquinone/menaquinone biosynthesis C-methylase UbiE